MKITVLIRSKWNISRNDSRFQYYERFILSISTAKYYNLEMFDDFAKDRTLENVDFLQVAYEVKRIFWINVVSCGEHVVNFICRWD